MSPGGNGERVREQPTEFNLECLPLGTGEISLEGARVIRLDDEAGVIEVRSLAQGRELAMQVSRRITTMSKDAMHGLAEYGNDLVGDWRLDGGQSSYFEKRDQNSPSGVTARFIYRNDDRLRSGFARIADALRSLQVEFEPQDAAD